MFIEDGTGSGRSMKVDVNNRATVTAVTRSEEANIAIEGDAYFMTTTTTANTLTSTATGGPVMYVQNDSTTKRLEVALVSVSSNTAGIVTILKTDVELGTIGNNNVYTPVNSNTGSTKAADGTFHTWDEVGDGMTGVTGGSDIMAHILPAGTLQMPLGGVVILAPGGTFALYFHGAGEVNATIRLYFEDIEE